MATELDRERELTEWSPGVPDAARGAVLGAFGWGALRAWRSKGLILCLWIVNLGVALALVAPLYSRIRDHTASSTLAEELSRGFTAVWWTDFSFAHGEVLDALTASLWVVGPLYLLLHVFLAGGVITLLHSQDRFPFFARFGSACGAYFGRFVRLLLVALACYGAVLWLDGRLDALVDWWTDDGALQARAWWGQLGRATVTVVLFFFVSLVFDFAKVRTVVTDSRAMILEAARSFAFVGRHLVRTGILYVLLAAVGGALMAVYWAGARGLEVAGAGVGALFLLQQLYLASRLWLRLATWGSAISLYRGIAAEELASR